MSELDHEKEAATPVLRPRPAHLSRGALVVPAVLVALGVLMVAGILTMDVVGEDITNPAQAAAARDAYLELVDRLKPLELGTRAEMSVKLSMFGQALEDGHELALEVGR